MALTVQAALRGFGDNRLLVLGWHNVEGSWCFPSTPGRGAKGLERQLRALRRLATVVPLSRALADLAAGRPLPPAATAITFDDGYRDTLTLAAPLLAHLGLPATVFLVPGILSGEVDPWWERLGWAFTQAAATAVEFEGRRLRLSDPALRQSAFGWTAERLKRRNRHERERAVEALVSELAPSGAYRPDELFLDWDGARDLCRAGLSIGSHSMYHAILSEESTDAQRTDLLQSRRLLESGLGVAADLFAYPNGTARDYDEASMAAVDAAGHTHAITTQGGWTRPWTPPHEVRRWVMYPERGIAGLAVIPRDLLRDAAARRSARRSAVRAHARST